MRVPRHPEGGRAQTRRGGTTGGHRSVGLDRKFDRLTVRKQEGDSNVCRGTNGRRAAAAEEESVLWCRRRQRALKRVAHHGSPADRGDRGGSCRAIPPEQEHDLYQQGAALQGPSSPRRTTTHTHALELSFHMLPLRRNPSPLSLFLHTHPLHSCTTLISPLTRRFLALPSATGAK